MPEPSEKSSVAPSREQKGVKVPPGYVFAECPHCGADIRCQKLGDSVCFCCGRPVRVWLDPEGRGSSAVISPEPLFLPKGCVRALCAMLVIPPCWILMARGIEIPDYLFGLALTIAGYYFGLRKPDNVPPADSMSSVKPSVEDESFNIPKLTRSFILWGFLICGLAVFKSHGLAHVKMVEFYFVFTGLAAGYFFALLMSKSIGTSRYNTANHLKAGAALAASLCLCALLVAGRHEDLSWVSLSLACAVSFYFGSRS